MSSPFGEERVSEVLCDSSKARDAKRMVSIPRVALPESVIVATDHGPCGSMAAFFKESMRRDAMMGTNTMSTLWGKCHSRPMLDRNEAYTPGMS
jgi:hypothetical protein